MHLRKHLLDNTYQTYQGVLGNTTTSKLYQNYTRQFPQ
uniref:Uncharacterized protein n=1 Tax=Arundo donax TaxID=35708 RepID=A0A0A9B4Q0_ARUDO